MTMRRRLLSLLLLLALVLSLGICSAAAEEDFTIESKALYGNDPLYIDLNLNAEDITDDANFVVMREGSAILYADASMSMDASDDNTTYTLYNPTSEAKRIAPGTPVAFVDETTLEAFFFLPTQVTVQSDRMVFTCSPEDVQPEELFFKIGIDTSKTFPFSQNLSFSNPAGTLKFSGALTGDFYVQVKYNGFTLETNTWVSYNLKDAVLEVSDNFSQEIPILKFPFSGIPGVGLEVGVGLGLFVEGDTKVSFDMQDGKTGFGFKAAPFSTPKFSNLSQKPQLNVEEIIANGSFEVDLTLGPSLDVLSVAGIGCDIAAGIAISADLTGDEGGRDPDPLVGVQPINPNEWHVCKELSCLQGEIDALVKLEAWAQLAGHVWSAHYDLAHEKYSDFHYSFTFKEFELAPCEHYLYQVDVRVLEQGSQKKTPMEGVTVTYTEVPPYADRRGKSYIEGVTDKDGYIYLYMPVGDVKITATSWQDDPDTPVTDPRKVSTTAEYKVRPSKEGQKVDIELIRYHFMTLVYFDENAGGETVENMPNPFWVEENHTGTIPNEVPRREGYIFVGWSADKNSTTAGYIPGAEIKVEASNIQLFANWTKDQPKVNFRTITYVADGDGDGADVVLADNPQIYFSNVDGFPLVNPWRKDYVFVGWTCEEEVVGLTTPKLDVTVQWNQKFGTESDFVNRTYVANWKPVTYNVFWLNWDGALLDANRDLDAGVIPIYTGETPHREPDDSWYYVFSSWQPAIEPVSKDTTYTATYTSYPLLKLLSSPQDAALRKAESAVFRVTVSGGQPALAYQWYMIPAGQSGDPASGAGSPISGATTPTLSVTADYAMDGNRYYCVVQDSVAQRVVSDAAMLTVRKSPLVLLSSPQDISVKKGETAPFTVSVSGGELPLTYQWYLIPAGQSGDPASGAGSPISGATSDRLSVTGDYAMDGNRYYCVVQDVVAQQVVSAAATLRVTQSPLKLLFSPDDACLESGETATFAVGVSGGELPLTYQWYRIPAGQSGDPASGAGSPISGANAATLTVTASQALNGYRYYCVVQDVVNQRVISGTATLYVSQPALILLQSPQDATRLVGEDAVFSVSVSGGVQPYTYQWYVIPGTRGESSVFASAIAEEGTPVAGAVSSQLTVTASIELNGNQYYCVIQDDIGQKVVSEAARLDVVKPAPQTGDQFPLLPLLAMLLGCGTILVFGYLLGKNKFLGNLR